MGGAGAGQFRHFAHAQPFDRVQMKNLVVLGVGATADAFHGDIDKILLPFVNLSPKSEVRSPK